MDLLSRLLDLRRREHLCTVDLLEALLECQRNRAYLDHGYDSLWSFLIGALHYSKGAASRRYRALKCARKFPVVIEWLRTERVTLCSLEAIASLLDSIETEQALLDRIDGKSQAEVQQIVAQSRPVPEPRETLRREFVQKRVVAPTALFGAESGDVDSASIWVASLEESAPAPAVVSSSASAPTPTPPQPEERVRVSLSLTPEEFALIERARAIASRRPGRTPTVREMVVETARFYVEKKAPKQRAEKQAKEQKEPMEPNEPNAPAADAGAAMVNPAPNNPSRHIPPATRDAVILRDGERCTFVSASGQRCQATHDLQIDHVVPFALGGSHDPENLRVLCGAHNRRRAELTFGEWILRE